MNIPNLPVDKMVDELGNPSGPELIFRQTLVQALQQGAGPEGLVCPTLTASQITTIQNNQNSQGAYTCQYGTIVYNSTANSIMIAVNSGSNTPLFKTVTLT
jgi:hypothetical protein